MRHVKDNNALNGTPANTLRDTSADAPPQDTLRDAPRIATPPFETDILIQPNRHGVYRYGALMVWILATTAMVLDRFYWNIWPRESICTHGCGKDICNIEETFEVFTKAGGRVIISATSLMFITMCHGTFNVLSEVPRLAPYLYAWRRDNCWLHSIGGWTMGAWVMLHVWSLILPSMFDGFTNKVVGGEWDVPLQVSLEVENLDEGNKTALWGYDDVWRIIWMTVIFAALMPLSRSAWALRKNFTLATWLHMLIGFGVFFDSWRRKTHPHVWILNTPAFFWWLVDKILCATYFRVDPCAEATRILLDDDYMLFLWKVDHSNPKRICDLFWIKRGHDPKDPFRSGSHSRLTGELSHPFATCSHHDVLVGPECEKDVPVEDKSASSSSIELPTKMGGKFSGPRFTLTSALSRMSSGTLEAPLSARRGDSYRGRRAQNKAPYTGSSAKLEEERCTSVLGNATSIPRTNEGKSAGGRESMVHEVHGEFEEALREEAEHGTMIGVDVSGRDSEDLTVVVGKIVPREPSRDGDEHGHALVTGSVQDFLDEELGGDANEESREETKEEPPQGLECLSLPEGRANSLCDLETVTDTDHGSGFFCGSFDSKGGITTSSVGQIMSPGYTPLGLENQSAPAVFATSSLDGVTLYASKLGSRTGKAPGVRSTEKCMKRRSRTMLKRMDAETFLNHRRREEQEGRGGVIPRGWSKMAIVRVHRRDRPTVRECSCLGLTCILSCFRKSETGIIADLESSLEDGTVPLRTHGPYRSEYGRLREFPNLPPLLVVATGAGAALVLDFVAYVRSKRLAALRLVRVYYSSDSLPLLQFVTNTLLAERNPGINIKTALTRHDDLEAMIASASGDTEVYFCGGNEMNTVLRRRCSARGMKYVGSSVQ